MSYFAKLNNNLIEIETVEDEHEEAMDFKPSFWWNNRRNFLEKFVRVHENPWIGNTGLPEYIHGYDPDNYHDPEYIELVGGDKAVNIYKELTEGFPPDVVLLQKEADRGLTAQEASALFGMLGDVEAFPLDIEAENAECAAMGFISAPACDRICFDTGGLRRFVSDVLDDQERESRSGLYIFKGVCIWLGYSVEENPWNEQERSL